MSHGDSVVKIPEHFATIAETENGIPAGLYSLEEDIWTLQFHPEVKHTEHGMKIIENFVFNICKMEPNWNMEKFLEDMVKKLREETGDGIGSSRVIRWGLILL